MMINPRIIYVFLGMVCLLLSTAVHSEETVPVIRVAVLRDINNLEAGFATICNREYKGILRFIKNKQGTYLAVNTLDIENFLLGVIGREMDPDAPLEALKAQAIAARSHALYQASIASDQPYDLIANISQAYWGKVKLHKNVVLAIEITRGQVLYYQNKPFPAYFHESCGGHTETTGSIWQTNLQTPGAVTCPYCSKTSKNKWSFEIADTKLQHLLQQAGCKIDGLSSIHVREKALGGHAIMIALRTQKSEIPISAEKLRAIVGYSNLKSTLFRVQHVASRFSFQGDGYGHGVGLCQFGAQKMAGHGSKYQKILTHYFPQCKIGPYTPEESEKTKLASTR